MEETDTSPYEVDFREVNGKKKLKRLANALATNDHLQDIPRVFTTSSEDARALNMPVPKVEHQLKGHMSYVSEHISDLYTAREPLNSPLEADVKLSGHAQQESEKCKKLEENTTILAHSSPKLAENSTLWHIPIQNLLLNI